LTLPLITIKYPIPIKVIDGRPFMSNDVIHEFIP
jgi:hypothetical protein